MGGVGAGKVVDRLSKSRAAKTGLLEDLEDSALLIPGIGPDIISDIATHVIRGALIGYTHRACEYYGIPLEDQYSGHIWNPDKLDWEEGWIPLPRAEDGSLLLIPKSIVRFRLTYDKDKYFNGFLAPYLEDKELDSNSQLVTTLKNGKRTVFHGDLKKKYATDKLSIVRYSQEFREALPKYRSSISRLSSPVLTHEQIAEVTDTPEPNYNALLDELLAIPPGNAAATVYHRAAEKLLTAITYPYLGNVQLEREIHEGRKRIDITYDNLAPRGTFYWLTANYRAATIPVECKNYTRDIANPELDQIAGRFSDRRGWVGIVVCRRFEDKALFLDRCRDTARDGRGYIVALDDDDMRGLVRERITSKDQKPQEKAIFKVIHDRFNFLIS